MAWPPPPPEPPLSSPDAICRPLVAVSRVVNEYVCERIVPSLSKESTDRANPRVNTETTMMAVVREGGREQNAFEAPRAGARHSEGNVARGSRSRVCGFRARVSDWYGIDPCTAPLPHWSGFVISLVHVSYA